MIEGRTIFGDAPRKVQATRSRMDETPAREGDIPAYFRWADGSEYEVYWGYVDRLSRQAFRRYHGPLFGLPIGQWKTVEFNA